MAEPQKKSILQVNEGIWRVFCDWCKGMDLDPLQASVRDVAGFMLLWHEETFYMEWAISLVDVAPGSIVLNGLAYIFGILIDMLIDCLHGNKI